MENKTMENESMIVTNAPSVITSDEWLFNANEKHIRRIHDALYKVNNGKQTRPIYDKLIKSLKFAIDNYHTPVHFRFNELYRKYSKDTTIDRGVMLLFNAMEYDNDYANSENNANMVLYILSNDLSFLNSDICDSVTNGFLEALANKISGKPNVKFILEHYRDLMNKINKCIDEYDDATIKDEKAKTNNMKRSYKLVELKNVIDKCLYIEYTISV